MSISFPEGSDFPVIIEAVDINGNTINLTAATVIRLSVYYRPREASDALVVYDLPDIVITDGAHGLFKVTFVAGDLTEGEYSFDCWATLADATNAPIGRGDIDVTHFDSLEI